MTKKETIVKIIKLSLQPLSHGQNHHIMYFLVSELHLGVMETTAVPLTPGNSGTFHRLSVVL